MSLDAPSACTKSFWKPKSVSRCQLVAGQVQPLKMAKTAIQKPIWRGHRKVVIASPGE